MASLLLSEDLAQTGNKPEYPIGKHLEEPFFKTPPCSIIVRHRKPTFVQMKWKSLSLSYDLTDATLTAEFS